MSLDTRLESFKQAVQRVGDDTTHDIIKFPGTTPIIVEQDQSPIIYTQNGDAVGFGAAFIAPAAPTGAHFLGGPQVTTVRLDDGARWQTSWSYVYVLATALTIAQLIALSEWPATPTFEVPA